MIEILTRLRLPVEPQAPDDVARLEDIQRAGLGFPPDAVYDLPGVWFYSAPVAGLYSLFAGGGGGGGSSSMGSPPVFAGGGGGGVARLTVRLAVGDTLTVTVGAGGAMHAWGEDTSIGGPAGYVNGNGGRNGDGYTGGEGGGFIGEDGLNGNPGSPAAGGTAQVIYGSTLTGTVSFTGAHGGAPTNSGGAGRALITYVGG